MRNRVLNLFILSLSYFLMACQGQIKGSPIEDASQVFKETYHANSEKWGLLAEGKSYEYAYMVSCFCINSGWEYQVLVNKDGNIESASYKNLEGEVFTLNTDEFKNIVTVFDLFNFVEYKISGKVDELRVQYNNELGYPSIVQIDYNFRMADDEISYSVTSLSFK